MKVIIAGCRDVHSISVIESAINRSGYRSRITEVVSGGASGVDLLGEEWAESNGVMIAVFPAKWGVHGKAAGPIRNREMANYADALIAVWDGCSRGTKSMIEEATRKSLRVFVHEFDRRSLLV